MGICSRYSVEQEDRREAKKQDIAFMWLSGLEMPDFRTLCLFRTNNKEALEKVFTDVIVIARSMGMATLGLVALDGSKVRANSGIDTFKKLGDWKELLKEAKNEAQRIISEAERIDKEEDKIHGSDKRGDELPKQIEKAKDRIEKMETLIKKFLIKRRHFNSEMINEFLDRLHILITLVLLRK